MIKKLSISNFALIDDLDMTFEEGLTAMTGETGAGKSIILESLQLLFGKRSDATMVRHGHQKARVFGLFELNNEQSKRFELPNELEIEREIDLEGRHMMKINGQTTTLSKLKDLMSAIGSIHSQHDTMLLMDKNQYLSFVDQVDQVKTDQLHANYLLKRSHYLELKKKFDQLKHQKAQSIEKQSYLEFQIQELSSFDLKIDEKKQLEEQVEKLKHHDRIMSQLNLSYQAIENESFSIDLIYEAAKALEKISQLDPVFNDLCERLKTAYYDLDDVKSTIYQQIETLDFDQASFDQMQDRIYEITKIETKYQKSENELILYLEQIKDEYLMITDYDQYVSEANQKAKDAFEKAYELGLELSKHRKTSAKKLEKSLVTELKDLDLDKASFEVLFENIEKDETSLMEHGLDQIDFMISLNEGEPIKPLSKVASGGERARFMFALRSIYAKSNELSMLILDEIDIGISGKTAAKVAQKMIELSKMMQVIVITHLPQVAAKANHHYGIFKTKEKERMVTRIQKLKTDERIEMIAHMLSDEKLTHFAIEQAKLLLDVK